MFKLVKYIFPWCAGSRFLQEFRSPPQMAGKRNLRDSQRVEIHAKLLMFSKMMAKTSICPIWANRKKNAPKTGHFYVKTAEKPIPEYGKPVPGAIHPVGFYILLPLFQQHRFVG